MIDVSVVLAARNEHKYVEEAVRSIAGQAGLTFELLFVDDNSTDDTYAIVSALADANSTIRLVRNPGRGKCSAFNYGVSLARGRFVCLFAGDDIMPAGSLAERYEAVASEPDDIPSVGLCKLITMSEIPSEDGHVVPKAPGRGGITGVSYLMNRPAVAKMFPVPESFPNEDTWLEQCVRHLGWKVVHCGAIGCKYRVHAGNSINLRLPFKDFNQRLTLRLGAIALFLETFRTELSPTELARVKTKVQIEKKRTQGDLFGILMANAPLKERLRAAAYSGPLIYELRRRLYGLLSGL